MADKNPDKGYVAILGWSLNAINAIDNFDRRYIVVAPEWAEQYARDNDIPFIPWNFE
ncbi:MAG: carboxylate--amine ligase, partial [Candidatus Competibacteraceae bacterium]|nr:carboxylate--amine ligase [Candidatus Competibacteraceae bacterium]MDX1656189.1 carboxylate--amine ligase [Candidatus Competibacteraceae bacterium]